MNNEHESEAFAQRTRALLEDSVEHLDGHVRSRLTQARHAALDEVKRRESRSWLQFAPAGAVAAVAIVAVAVWTQRPVVTQPTARASTAFEDIELLTDAEMFDLSDGEDFEFYEWAANETEASADERET